MLILWLLLAVVFVFGLVVFRGAPYLPTKKKDLAPIFSELYPLSNKDLLVDIGSGDGVVLRAAAAHGARAVGYELNPILVVISRFLSRDQPGVEVILADFWRQKLPNETTVVYTFGESRDINKMARKVEEEATRLGRPLMFISYGFAVKEREVKKQVGLHRLYVMAPLQKS